MTDSLNNRESGCSTKLAYFDQPRGSEWYGRPNDSKGVSVLALARPFRYAHERRYSLVGHGA
jgi:hypothetical protein